VYPEDGAVGGQEHLHRAAWDLSQSATPAGSGDAFILLHGYRPHSHAHLQSETYNMVNATGGTAQAPHPSMLRAETVRPYIEQSKWGAVLATVGALFVLRFVLRKTRPRFPPGPKRIPLLGNVFNFPTSRWYEAFTRWKDEYGALISLHHRPRHSVADMADSITITWSHVCQDALFM
jgi:hypothetical protein